MSKTFICYSEFHASPKAIIRQSILGDPGADHGGKGKSKPAKENGNEEMHSRARRAPGDLGLSCFPKLVLTCAS